MHALCEKCAVSSFLKEVISESGNAGKCSVCLNNADAVLSTEEQSFVRAIKALIRYHYSEWEYHSKLGGDSFESLLSKENPIVKFRPELDSLLYEDFLLSFLDNLDADTEITITTAYGRDIYESMPMYSLIQGRHPLLGMVRRCLTERNHFLVEADFEKEFAPLRSLVEKTVQKGRTFYRARIGAVEMAENYDQKMDKTAYYKPLESAEIGAPPVGVAGAGRLNRPGVSFLYLATNVDTAICEIRPHPGEVVSVGSFVSNRDILIADFSAHSLKRLWRNDSDLELLELIISTEKALATMAPPSNRQLYSLTQFVAEVFRRMGFEGVQFKSSVGNGVNLVIFDPELMQWVPGSGNVVKVETVVYSHSPCSLFDENEAYDNVRSRRIHGT